MSQALATPSETKSTALLELKPGSPPPSQALTKRKLGCYSLSTAGPQGSEEPPPAKKKKVVKTTVSISFPSSCWTLLTLVQSLTTVETLKSRAV